MAQGSRSAFDHQLGVIPRGERLVRINHPRTVPSSRSPRPQARARGPRSVADFREFRLKLRNRHVAETRAQRLRYGRTLGSLIRFLRLQEAKHPLSLARAFAPFPRPDLVDPPPPFAFDMYHNVLFHRFESPPAIPYPDRPMSSLAILGPAHLTQETVTARTR